MSKRIIALFLVLTMLMAALPMVSAQDDIVISWWTEADNSIPTNIQELFVEPWNEANPGYVLEITEHEGINDVVRTAIAAGEAPDIIQTPGAAFIAEFVDAGLIQSLDPYVDEWGWEEKLLPWAYASGLLEGSLYSVPLTYESMILLYNKTLFEEQGWEVPTTLAEMEELAEMAVAEDILPFIYGNSGWQPANEHLIGIYYNNYVGPELLYQALTGEKDWTDPEFVEAMELLKKHLAENGWFGGSLEDYFALGWDDYWATLPVGDAAMMMIGSWGFRGVIEPFEEAGMEWDWAPLPMFSEAAGPYNYELATGSTLSINGQSEHADVAASVIDDLISDPARVLEMSATQSFGEYMVPVHITAEDFPAGTDERLIRFFADFAEVTGEGRIGYTTWTFWPADPNVQLWQDIELVWYDEMTVEDYLAIHQELWDEAREAGKTLNVPAPGMAE